MLKHVLVMLLLAPTALVWGASEEATWGNGLEDDSTTPLRVLIEEVPEDANKIGLSRERIEARVNQSLRKAGITPVSGPLGTGDCLYVSVHVIGRGSFAIRTSFERPVFYWSGGKWLTIIGSTWRSGGIGVAHSADYILDSITQNVEVFCNEFLKANGK